VHRRPELVVLVGLPASGKSTFTAARFAATHVVVSKDRMPRSARNKRARQRREIEAALAEGRSVVVDNVNATVEERAEIVQVAHALGARAVAYVLESTTRESVARNAGREGKARVPNVAIFTAAKRLVLPERTEGFDEVHRVQIANGWFSIERA
jgi:predicted kinase